MSINKYLLGFVSCAIWLSILVGCGSVKEDVTGKTEGNNGAVEESLDKEPEGIVADSLKTNIEKVEGTEFKYVFSIQNDTENDQTLVFPTSQEYDFSIKNEKGEILYTYSMDKSFLQATKEKIVKPGEKVQFEIDIMEGLQNIPSGTYKVEIWATLQDNNDLRSEIEIDYQAPIKESKQVVNTTVPVTYVGQIDGNSIEVKNEEGLPEVYRLSEVTKNQVNSLSEDDVITIEFITDSNGLRVAQYFTVVSK